MTGYTLNWLFIYVAMEGIRVLVADGKVVSIGIIFDLVYIELTFHTQSDVKYKNIGSWWKGAFEGYRLWLGIHWADNA